MRVPVVVGLLLSGVLRVEPASADPLSRATLEFTLLGIPVTLTSTSVTGTFLSSGRFTLEPGSGFATSFCVGPFGCRPPAAPLQAPITRVVVQAGRNGGIDGRLSDATIEPCGAGISCKAVLRAKFGKAPAFSLLAVPFHFGEQTTQRFTSSHGSLAVTVEGSAWHLGAVTATGLTTRGAPLPDVMATGGVQITPLKDVVTLVSLSRIRLRGLTTSTSAIPVRLSLFYDHGHPFPGATWACPEPGSSALLGGAAIGLLGAGWRIRRTRRAAAAP